MTAIRSSHEFGPIRQGGTTEAAAVSETVSFPGRWVGGAVGALASVLVGAALLAAGAALDLDVSPAAFICVLGIPIAFVLGRLLAPLARDGDWRSAMSAAVTFGLVAPPLGDIEIVGGSLMAPWSASFGSDHVLVFGLLVGLIGLGVSYIAAPITVTVGVVWVVLMRTLPIGDLARYRMPPSLARFGVRHVVAVLGAWLVVVQIWWALAGPSAR